MLESRRLFSTVFWSNRGATSGPNDDGFNSVFGANAGTARAVVDAALSSWGQQIVSFNFPGGGNTYTMTIKMATSGTSNGANAGPSHYTSDGKPDTGSMTIGRGGDTGSDGLGDGGGYFLDPTPTESSEFQNYTNNAFAAYAGAASAANNKADLYEVVLHELGHAMGFSPGTVFNARNTKTTTADSADPASNGVAGPIGFYYRFDGATTHGLLTSYDSGGQNSGPFDFGNAEHYAPAGTSVTVNGTTYFGADDLMTPYYLNSQRRQISQNDIGMLADAYGYTVNSGAAFGSMYDTLDSDGTLRIKPALSNNGEQISVSAAGLYDTVTISGGSPVVGADPTTITSQFNISQVKKIVITIGNGTNTITVSNQGGVPTTVTGGTGSDTVILNGVATGGGTTTFTNGTIIGPGIDVAALYGINSVQVNGSSGNDVYNVADLHVNYPVSINGLGGNDTVNVGSGGYLDEITPAINFDGGSGTNSIDYNGTYTDLSWTYSIYQGSFVTVSDGQNFGHNATDLLPNVQNISVETSAYGYGGTFFVYQAAAGSNIGINGGAGNDALRVGSSIDGRPASAILGTVNFAGGAGSNYVEVDDTGASAGRTYTLTTQSEISNVSGRVNWDYQTQAFYLSGSANFGSTYNFSGGSDNSSYNITGGNGNDTFNITGGAYYFGSLAGSGGTDTVNVDDRNPSFTLQAYIIGATSFTRDIGPAAFLYTAYTFAYSGIEALVVHEPNNAPTTTITGVPPTPGSQFTIFGGSGSDSFTLVPHDPVTDALTINGSLGISGGGGADTFTVDDRASSLGVDYSFSNPFGAGTQDIGGMGLGLVGIGNDVESLAIRAGDGNDTFALNSYKSGQALAVYGGGGSDIFSFSPLANDLAASLTSIASFLFDGGVGYDALYVYNNAVSQAWAYTRDATGLTASRAGYYVHLTDTNSELTAIYGGAGANVYDVPQLASGVAFTAISGTGNDNVNIGSAGTTQDVSGLVTVYGDAGDVVTVDDHADVTGRTFHTGPYTVGGLPGDDLLGSGGQLYTPSAVNVVVNLGSGADTVYAQPAIYGHITINGSDPTDAPGDTLVLALGAFADAVVTPTSATDGNVTVGDGTGANQVERLAYTGFETGPTTDSLLPAVTGMVFVPLADGSQDLVVSYNTALIGDPGIYILYFANTLTGGALYADSETYDPNTLTSTFHFLSGDLPAGVYHTTIAAGNIVSPSGNIAAADATYDFIWVPSGVTLQLPLTGDGTVAFDTQQIAIDPTGTLDITNNVLVVRGGNLDLLTSLTALGLNVNGVHLWTGTGITSSLAAAETDPLHAVGVISNTLDGSSIYDSFHGVSVGGSDVLIAYTVFGDADLSGTVDDTDYFLTNSGFGLQKTGWLFGDFDYSGAIDDTDFFLLNSGYASQ